MMRPVRLAALVASLAVLLAPLALLLAAAFLDERGRFRPENLRALWLSARQWALLGNSLRLAAGAAVCSLLLAVPLATLVEKSDLPARGALRMAALLPMLIPSYLHALVWTRAASAAGLLDTLHTPAGGIAVYTLALFPFAFLVISAGLREIAPSLEEVSLALRGPWATIRRVTLPLVTPQITTGALLVFVFALVNFEAADILRLKLYPVEIFVQFSAFYEEGRAALLSLPLVAAASLLVAAEARLMRGRSYAALQRRPDAAPVVLLGGARAVAALAVALVAGVAGLVPVLALASGAWPPSRLARAFAVSRAELGYSLLVSAVSALAMTLISIGLAHAVARASGRGRTLLDFLTQCTFGIPSIVIGIGMVRVWNRPGLDWIQRTPLMLILGYLSAYAPFVIRILAARFAQVPARLEEAAILARGPGLPLSARVILPLALPGAFAGFLAGFVLSLTNLGTALLTTTPGYATLPVKIYNLMHYGADELVLGAAFIMVAVVGATLAAGLPVYRFLRRRAGV